MKITIFSEELRECLDAAGLSDCGENDTWNYWYQRLMNAYNESVERQIMTEQTENAELREQIHWLKQGDILHVLTDQEYIDQSEREHLMQVSIDALDKENAKLRELIADLWEYIHIGTAQDGQSLHDRTRELGVDA